MTVGISLTYIVFLVKGFQQSFGEFEAVFLHQGGALGALAGSLGYRKIGSTHECREFERGGPAMAATELLRSHALPASRVPPRRASSRQFGPLAPLPVESPTAPATPIRPRSARTFVASRVFDGLRYASATPTTRRTRTKLTTSFLHSPHHADRTDAPTLRNYASTPSTHSIETVVAFARGSDDFHNQIRR